MQICCLTGARRPHNLSDMAKMRRISIKSGRRPTIPGTSPGSVQPGEDALKPRISIYTYDKDHFVRHEAESHQELKQALNRFPHYTHWVQIKGLNDIALLNAFREELQISALVLEDIVNTHQRPKLEEYPSYCFATSRMLGLNKELQLENKQLSFILTKNVLYTFQDDYSDFFDPVRKRLEEENTHMRNSGPSYMMYSLMDLVLDNYFGLISRFSDELDMLEERLYRRPDKTITYDAQQIKRAFVMMKRAAWPERDKLNDMLRSGSELISADTRIFLRDAYDHAIQIIDLVESSKEISSGLIDMYLSFNSNRMNEIVKVLTIISAIFIPLTFIAGVYGMNFARVDPETGKIFPLNMPELYHEDGYIYTLAAMLIIVLLQLLWFWRKGWLK